MVYIKGLLRRDLVETSTLSPDDAENGCVYMKESEQCWIQTRATMSRMVVEKGFLLLDALKVGGWLEVATMGDDIRGANTCPVT